MSIANIANGYVKRITDAIVNPGASINIALNKEVIYDDFVSNIVRTADISSNNPEGPPYPNILSQFASYTPLFTFAVLEPSQLNDPYTYRNNPASLKHIIFSSAGRFDSQRQTTSFTPAPEYFVENFSFKTQITSTPSAGNTNIMSATMEVIEPYSMGLLLQSLAAGAISAGYPSYNESPFLVKLDFVGFKQDGAVFTSTEKLSKYFIFGIKDIKFTVDEGGSRYSVELFPYSFNALTDTTSRVFNDVKLSGEKVIDVLSQGQESLCAALNKIQLKNQKEGIQDIADEYVILFPTDWTDTTGLNVNSTVGANAAIVDPQLTGTVTTVSPAPASVDFGQGPIGQASMGFGLGAGGNYDFAGEADAIDPDTGVLIIDKMTIDPKKRTFSFPAGTPIIQMISQVILASQYAAAAIKSANLDEQGMIQWFKIEPQIQLLGFDGLRGRRARKFIYRVVPYFLHASVFRNPTAAPPGYDKLRKVCAKQYNYIYTGQNNDLLKFEISINSLFHTMKAPVPIQQSDTVTNKDVQKPSDEPVTKPKSEEGNNPAALGTIGSSPALPNKQATKPPTKGGYGATSVEEHVAIHMNNAILYSAKDLIEIEIEILGDPYFLVDHGMGNYLGVGYTSPKDQITGDGTMNYSGTETFVNMVFRTPVDPNLGTENKGGLFAFPPGESENPYSGLYRVITCTNNFKEGVFTQTLKMNRMVMQPQDFPEGYRPDRAKAFAVNTEEKEESNDQSVIDI